MTQQTKQQILSDMEVLKGIIEQSFNTRIMNRKRYREVVDARMVFAKIIRERGHTFKSIGKYLCKDHSTIIHYVEQVPFIFKTDKKLLELYVECKNKFIENREPIVLHSDKDLVKEILSLRSQLDEIMCYYQDVKKTEDKYKRLDSIINLIDLRTPVGNENIIRRKINELFNE